MSYKVVFGDKVFYYKKAAAAEMLLKAKDGDVIASCAANIQKALEDANYSVNTTNYCQSGSVFNPLFWFANTKRIQVLTACAVYSDLALFCYIRVEHSPNRLPMNKMFSQPIPLP